MNKNMCVTESQVKTWVKEVIAENNRYRDAQFDIKLNKHRDEITRYIQNMFDASATPEARREIANIKERCSVRDRAFAVTEIKMRNIQSGVEELKSAIAALDEKIDKKYAPMAAWTVIKWGGAIVGAGIIGALLRLIIS